MADFKVTGGCLCGGMKYEYTSRPSTMTNCYCSMCRRALGAPYGVFVEVEYPKQFRLIKSDTLGHYKSSEKVERSFCKNCGGGVWDRYIPFDDKIYVNAGSVDGDPGISPTMNIFAKSKAPWLTLDKNIPTFDELPPEYEAAK